jgi:hypothetical protein
MPKEDTFLCLLPSAPPVATGNKAATVSTPALLKPFNSPEGGASCKVMATVMAHENHPGGQLVGRYKHQIETSKIKINQDCAGILDPLNLITLRNRPDSSLLSELRAAYNEFIIARALGLEFVQQQRIRSKPKFVTKWS